MDRNSVKLEGKSELFTFGLAILIARLCCSNYLLFGKVKSVGAALLPINHDITTSRNLRYCRHDNPPPPLPKLSYTSSK